jgi:predicted Zn-ribbon and HTH transcriptional regulator
MTATVRCSKCGVTVDVDKIDMPARCPDPRCPLNKREASMLLSGIATLMFFTAVILVFA